MEQCCSKWGIGMREDLQIKIKDNSRCTGGVPEIGKWYKVTDVNRPPKFRRREGIDGNVYFIVVDGIRTGVHGEHCETNGYDCQSHAAEFFEEYRQKQKEKEQKNDVLEEN